MVIPRACLIVLHVCCLLVVLARLSVAMQVTDFNALSPKSHMSSHDGDIKPFSLTHSLTLLTVCSRHCII